MRVKLGEYLGQRLKFTATFVRPFYRKWRKKEHAIIRDVCLAGDRAILTDHAWVDLTAEINKVPLGSKITFEADVEDYCKACGTNDYALRNLSNIRW